MSVRLYLDHLRPGGLVDNREKTGRDSRGRFVVKQQRGEILWSMVLGVLAAFLTIIMLS